MNYEVTMIRQMIADGVIPQEVVEKYFPELKENEDEKIREALLEHIKGIKSWEYFLGISKEQMIAWLEKQGEQKEYTFKSLPRLLDMIEPTSKAKAYCQKLIDALVKEGYTTDAKIVGECLKVMNGENVPMAIMDEKQGEQKQELLTKEKALKNSPFVEQKPVDIVAILKDYFANTPKEQQDKDWEELKHLNNFGWELIEQKSTDKVEPKFKQGEWIIFNGLILYVDEVVQGYYRTISIDGIPNSYDWDIDNAARLWTIQDAKCGDVLATKTGGVFIYKELLYDKPFAYCGVDKFGVFKDCNCGDGLDWTPYLSEVTPATKEQRDLLLKKMHEAGYEWDAEKKELKKIEQNPTWSEEDEKMLNSIIEDFGDGKTSNMIQEYFLKSLKSRVQPQPKQEWSEEDKRSIRDSIFYLKSAKKYFEKDDDILWNEKWFNLCIEFLEALYKKLQPQPQWKPSDEQIGALEHFVRSIAESGYASPHDNNTKLVYSLFNDLKKLREE